MDEQTQDTRLTLEWESPEYIYRRKRPSWYYVTGLMIVLGALNAFLVDNPLFAFIILIGGGLIIFLANKPPKNISYKLDWRGITINDQIYRFYEYASFWIIEDSEEGNTLLLSPNKTFAQQTMIPLNNIDPQDVSDILIKHLPEEPDRIPLHHRVWNYFGF